MVKFKLQRTFFGFGSNFQRWEVRRRFAVVRWQVELQGNPRACNYSLTSFRAPGTPSASRRTPRHLLVNSMDEVT